MKKKIITASLILLGFSAKLVAQETDEAPKAKVEKKIIMKKKSDKKQSDKTTVVVDGDKIIVDGEEVEKLPPSDVKMKKEKRVTVVVDGDKVTINGKPVDELSNEDMQMLKGKANHLRMVAPFIHGKIDGDFGNGSSLNGNFEMPMGDFDMMIDDVKLNKALLGVTTEKNEKGAVITAISNESGAEKAGLQKGDIITKVNDDKILNSEDLIHAISKHNPDEKITVYYLRDGKPKTTDAVLGKNNMNVERVFKFNDIDNMAAELAPMMGNQNFKMMLHNHKPKMGVKIQDVEEGNGVKVLEVDENTPAAKAGIQKNDVITEINGETIKTVDDLKDKTTSVKEGDILKVKYTRNGVSQSSEIKFPKKLKTADL